MLASPDCPRIEGWKDVLGDTVAPEQRSRYRRHVESCPDCRARLERTLLGAVRRFGSLVAEGSDPALADVLNRLYEVGPPPDAAPMDLCFLAPVERPDLLGRLGRYEVRELIGRGGMGIVLEAFDPALQRLVAIKVMAPELAGSTTARQRFTREARAAAAVRHERVVTVHAVHDGDSLPYLVMQHVAGESLQARLDRTGPLEVEEAIRIARETAAGLAAAHAQGLIHRDIKPANILLEGGLARVKITDFGLARLVDDVPLTQSGVVAGTPEYMAPEQARGEPADHRSDLFSLGCVLYALCTGRSPFAGPSALATLRRVREEEPPPIRSLRPAIPTWLETLVNRLLAKAPAERFQSAAEVAHLLEGHHAGLREPAASPAPAAAPAGSWRLPRRGGMGLLLGLALLPVMVLLFQAAPLPEAPRPGEFYQDFCANPDPLPPLELTGRDAAAETRPEPTGFRVTLPKQRTQSERAGLRLNSRLKGDFEITSSYEIIDAEQPTKGHGVGYEIFVEFDSPRRHTAELGRVSRVVEGEVYLCNHITTDNEGQPAYDPRFPQAAGHSGRLRMTRLGGEITLSATAATGDGFEELCRYDVGTEDVVSVCTVAFPGHAPNFLDLRILDLRVHLLAASESAARQSAAAGPPSSGSRAWLAAAGVSVAVVVVLSVVALYAATRARRTGSASGLAPAMRRSPQSLAWTRRRGTIWGWVALFTLLALSLLAVASWAMAHWAGGGAPATETPTGAYREDLYQDLRGRNPTESWLVPTGDDFDTLAVPDAGGLHVRIPRRKNQTAIGFQTTAPVAGDFEITGSYELLAADAPAAPGVVGVNLFILSGPADQGIGRIGRFDTRTEGAVYEVHHTKPGPPQVIRLPTQQTRGQLRLVREAGNVSYQVSDATRNGDFQELCKSEFGRAEVTVVRFVVNPGGEDSAVEARLLDLRIRSGAAAAGARAALPADGGGMTALLLAGLLGGVLVVPLGVWLTMRSGGTASPHGVPPDSAFVSFGCSSCGKGLRVRAAVAAKKVKCPQCGQVMPVPSEERSA
jgi:hypothetical protein